MFVSAERMTALLIAYAADSQTRVGDHK